jgi:hypothetical protein
MDLKKMKYTIGNMNINNGCDITIKQMQNANKIFTHLGFEFPDINPNAMNNIGDAR